MNKTNKVIKVCIPQTVKVRKYEVDTDELKQLLRTNKKKVGISNKEIALMLNKPLTLVEHWFRNDKCFAIPDADIWYQLKEILQITDSSFDKSITEFEYRDGVYEKSERCYLDIGIAPTLTTSDDVKIIITE
jgi:DNA (cytosine-5)-methyltransferase 1